MRGKIQVAARQTHTYIYRDTHTFMHPRKGKFVISKIAASMCYVLFKQLIYLAWNSIFISSIKGRSNLTMVASSEECVWVAQIV